MLKKLLVLIVPLWNWNAAQKQRYLDAGSFNRTFMELKYVWGNMPLSNLTVLIVPLWNWNIFM